MDLKKIEIEYNIKIICIYEKMILGEDSEGYFIGIVNNKLSKYYGDISILSKAFDIYLKEDRFDLSIIRRSRVKIIEKTKIKKGKIKFKPFIMDREIFESLYL
ncbi:hypothetical protein [Brevundimonas sp. FT23042]|jgi:hypothetical protein|uniref:hypothetical protein n=1 Tax=Brevundimonas sp. FT23042 TaxID=3393749 RepID=UPI003B5899D1